MLNDANYDIITMIAEDSQTLHRIDKYMKDSSDCKPCQDIWKKVKDNREKELAMLMDQLKKHIQAGASPHEKRVAA